jgi:hypothetical protein
MAVAEAEKQLCGMQVDDSRPAAAHPPGERDQDTAFSNMQEQKSQSTGRVSSAHMLTGRMGLTGGHAEVHTGQFTAGHALSRSGRSVNSSHKSTGRITEGDTGNTLTYLAPLPVNWDEAHVGSFKAVHDGSAATNSQPWRADMKLPTVFSLYSHSRKRSDPTSEAGNTSGVPSYAPPDLPGAERHDDPGHVKQAGEVPQIPGSGFERQMRGVEVSSQGRMQAEVQMTEDERFENLSTATRRGVVVSAPVRLNRTSDSHMLAGIIIDPAHVLAPR